MIRPFEKEDLPVLMDLRLSANMDAHAFIPAAYWAEHAGQVRTQLPRAEVYVCQQDAAAPIDGFIGINGTHIEGLFVKKACRSKGVGRQLPTHAKQLKPRLTLCVYRQPPKALSFYEREGVAILSEDTDGSTGEKELFMGWRR